jgi:3-methyladenine DNA glycosylase Tag
LKHLKKEKTLKKLTQNKIKLEKIRQNAQAALSLNKEKNDIELYQSIAQLYKKPSPIVVE